MYDRFSNIYPIKTQKVPLVGNIACGEPIYADEYVQGYEDASNDVKVDFALRTKGESMIGNGIKDSDIILVKKQSYVKNGEIAVVVIEDDATLKRVYYDKERQTLTLVASDPAIPPCIYKGSEIESIHILGLAVLLQR